MYRRWKVCASIDPVAARHLQPTLRGAIAGAAFGAVLFRILLFFVVSHEYTHIVQGHVSHTNSLNSIFNEIASPEILGSLHSQALEIDADGYAVFLVLNNLLRGDERDIAVGILGLEDETEEIQDSVLFSCFVMAAGGYFYHSLPGVVSVSNVMPPHIQRRQ